MKRYYLYFILFITFIPLLVTSCKGKEDEVAKEEEVVLHRPEPNPIGPHKAEDIKKWALDAEAKASEATLSNLTGIRSKYSTGEIIIGVAVRTKPDYWDKASDKDKLQTISIMNTNFSKVRINAGLAENVEVLNSTLYLEDGEGKIIAVSDPEKGGTIL